MVGPACARETLSAFSVISSTFIFWSAYLRRPLVLGGHDALRADCGPDLGHLFLELFEIVGSERGFASKS